MINNDYKSLSEEELDTKIGDVTKKINLAYNIGQHSVLPQLEFLLEELQVELKERLDKQRFDIINQKTPKRMLIGEDDGTEEENRDSTTAAKEG
mgnify:FL=1|jgi:hypothetical protein|tara:strand:+ start:113 stop:394 length:282 start_codon:yes stop_codon:yes gene_type:complete